MERSLNKSRSSKDFEERRNQTKPPATPPNSCNRARDWMRKATRCRRWRLTGWPKPAAAGGDGSRARGEGVRLPLAHRGDRHHHRQRHAGLPRLRGAGQFERDLIRERTMAGLAAARARGRWGGRPGKLTPELRRQAEAMLRDRKGYPFRQRRNPQPLEFGRTAFYHHFPEGTDPGASAANAGKGAGAFVYRRSRCRRHFYVANGKSSKRCWHSGFRHNICVMT